MGAAHPCAASRLWPLRTARPFTMESPSTDLQRFVSAQARDYAQALAELKAGRKQTHWMWYVFPQLRGLGRSAMAQEYGLKGREEAAAYLAHPVLGPRLLACVHAVLGHQGRSAEDILGNIDALKFRSCLTLFTEVAPEEPVFKTALAAFYRGEPDAETLRLLAQGKV